MTSGVNFNKRKAEAIDTVVIYVKEKIRSLKNIRGAWKTDEVKTHIMQ